MGCFSSKTNAGDAPPQVNFFDRYELACVLGRGSYGSVYLACNLESDDEFAVKVLVLSGHKKYPKLPMASQLPKDVNNEQRTLALIAGHPNVVALREAIFDDNFAFLVMELCTSSLLAVWMSESDLNEYTLARYFREMAQALVHIHSVDVVHRDVKQENFMVGAPDGRTVKLCDFGLSAVIVDGGSLSGHIGTGPYMAPEMLDFHSTHGTPADVWSFGVIVYIAFYGHWPYQPRIGTRAEMLNMIRDGTVPPCFAPPRRFSQDVVSETGIRFVKALLDRDPFMRPSAAACLEMAYLQTRRCHKLQAHGIANSIISLAPQLQAAKKCGAFNVRTPEADTCHKRLMSLQSVARSRRESALTGLNGAISSITTTPNAAGASPEPHQPEHSSTEDASRCIAQPAWKNGPSGVESSIAEGSTADTFTAAWEL